MATIPRLLYKSSGLFKKDYAAIVHKKQILPGTFFEINLHGTWRDYHTKIKVDINKIVDEGSMTICVPKERLGSFSSGWNNVTKNIIVLAYFKEHQINFNLEPFYATSDELEIIAYIPELPTTFDISVIQLDYDGRRLFNYDPINTIGVDLGQYKEIELGTLTVPGVKYAFHYGNETIRDRIIKYVKEKLREIKIC